MDNLISLMTVEEKSNQLANCYGYGIHLFLMRVGKKKYGLGLSCAHLEGNAGNWNNSRKINISLAYRNLWYRTLGLSRDSCWGCFEEAITLASKN
jgi:hypothetical protein